MMQNELVTPPPSASQAAKKSESLVGAVIAGKYKVIDKLGEGGMGSVYRARQMPIDRMVAVKVLLGKLAEDEVAVKRFEQEARAVARMQHPNTVAIYDYGKTDDGRLYLVMEFLKGRTLTNTLRSDGPLDAARTIRIIRQVCASLADAHGAGIIHRDLKPDNIFLTEVGGDKDFVKVLDFGVAKLADSEGAATLTQTGMIFGTPKYMSPEQAEGKPIDYRADIYAIGVVMYEMLTARPPFLADTAVALLLKHISEPPPPFTKIRPDLKVHPEVEAAVMKSLHKNPDYRFRAVTELSEALEHCLRTLTTGMVPVSLLGPQAVQAAAGGLRTEPVRPEGGLPTEVVPGKSAQSDLSPNELRPPQAVPAGLSLALDPPTQGVTAGRTGPVENATLPAGAGAREAAGLRAATTRSAAAATMPEAGVAILTPGATSPIPAFGGNIETLGGVLGDASGPLRPPKPKANTAVFAAGGVAIMAAGIAAFMVFARPKGDVTSSAIAPAVAPSAASELAVPVQAPSPAADPRPTVAPAPVAPSAPIPIPAPGSDLRRPRKEAAPRTDTNPAVIAPVVQPPAESRKVTLRFESTPPDAVVTYDGAQIGRTPLAKDFPKGLEVVTFEVVREGYETERVTTTLTQDRILPVTLTKIPSRGQASAAAAEHAPDPAKREKPPKPAKPAERDEGGTDLNERVEDLKDL